MHTLQRPGVPRLLHRPLPLRQRHRLPALRLAGGGRRVRSVHGRLLERRVRDGARRPARPARRRPAARCCFYLQSSSPDGVRRRDAAGASRHHQRGIRRSSCRTSGSRAPNLTVNYGLRWDAQLMPETVDPHDDRVRAVPERPAFPSDGTIPDQWKHVAAARRRSRGTSAATASRSCAAAPGVYFARQNMLSQVGSVTTNGIQQQTISSARPRTVVRDHAGVARAADADAAAAGTVPAVHRHPRVRPATTRTRASTRSTPATSSELRRDLAGVRRLHLDEGRAPDAVPQLQPQRAVVLRPGAGTRERRRLQRRTRGSRSSAKCW